MIKSEVFRKISIFSSLPESTVKDIGELMKRNSYKKGDILCSHEEVGDTLYIIESGQVKVSLYNEAGKEIILSLLKSGDFFGEMSLLDSEPRSANVIATKASELLLLKQQDFLNYLARFPNLALLILKEISRRLRVADEKIGNLALLDVYGRIARYLISLAQSDGIEKENGFVIENLPTHSDIAGLLGTSRETVTRTLAHLQKSGVIQIRGKNIFIDRTSLNETHERTHF
jgi:CRP-like cAMP-binding protein